MLGIIEQGDENMSMNPLYDKIFNQQYVNNDYLSQIQRQQYHAEQQLEIFKATKALRDYCDAARKISPEYQQQAIIACIATILEEMNKN